MSAKPARHLWTPFAALGPHDLYALLALRADVFVIEQRCLFADIDGRDPAALHLLAWMEGSDVLAGTLRLFPPGAGNTSARIGRVATARVARGQGLGAWMMAEAVREVALRFGPAAVELDAQADAEAFYTRFGFRRASADYDEDGIAHCRMRRDSV